MKKKNYLIGNAHLDPVWQWQWQEGASEARATFASALERMKEYPEFVFTCAGASVYEWVEKTAPALFREIQERVREGRWVIVGGMWVQPDCNSPSGESFARQILYSQRYFKEKFGVEASVGYNVDSFGHNWNLPQLLLKGGMGHYVYMRPMKHEKEMQQNLFQWEGPDGSRVTCFRIPMAYCCNFASREDMMQWFENSIAEQPAIDSSMLFYGVGNHGGGPTKSNIEFAKSLSTEAEQMIFASPAEYFASAEKEAGELPVHKDDLQHHASGCYAAVSEVKRLNRLAENSLLAAERFSSLASLLGEMPPAEEELREAWKGTMFSQFHDSLGGCSTQAVYPDIFAMQQESIARANRVENTALQILSQKIDTTCVPVGQQTLLVYNPVCHPVKCLVRVNRQAPSVMDAERNPVPSQLVFSPTSACTGRKDILFEAELPACGWRLYWLGKEEAIIPEQGLHMGKDWMENDFIRVEFDVNAGNIAGIYSKKLNKYIYRSAFVPVVYDETKHDTWSHALNFFDEKIGCFGNGSLTVLEEGPLVCSVKLSSSWGESGIETIFTLSAFEDTLDCQVRLDWHEKHKLLKLECDTGMESPDALYEIPYADITRPCDGEEEPGLTWTAALSGEEAAIIWNDSKYSSSVRGGTICLTAIRSPLYGDHGRERLPEHEFTDQGHFVFSYRLGYMSSFDRAEAARVGEAWNLAPRVIYDYVHPGTLPTSYYAFAGDSSVILSVLKRAEDQKGWVLRAVERGGKTCRAEIALTPFAKKLSLAFTPYEIKTLRLTPEGEPEAETGLTEEA